MNQKNYLTLDNEFISYCELNGVKDIEKLAKEIFNRGFHIIKYGETPNGFSTDKIITKETPITINSQGEEVKKLKENLISLDVENKKLRGIIMSLNKEKKQLKNFDGSSIYEE
jgi:hypothetical protein